MKKFSREWFAAKGRKGGKVKSRRKSAAARRNGLKGGRPTDFAYVNAGAASALTYLGQLAVPELSGGSWSFAASGFAFLNSFLPVSESVSLAVALAALYVSAIGYRFVKSWIPTLT